MLYVTTKTRHGTILKNVLKNIKLEKSIKDGENLYFVIKESVVNLGEVLYIDSENIYRGEIAIFEFD